MICVGGGPICCTLCPHSKIAGLATDVQQTTRPGYGKHDPEVPSPVGIGEKMSDDEHLHSMDGSPASTIGHSRPTSM